MIEAAIRFGGLGHAYRPGAWVFRELDGAFGRGRITALLGPNGRGKSTLLHALVGVLRPTEGWVEVDGRAALVPQLFTTAFPFSVLDMVLMGRARAVRPWSQPTRRDEELAREALDAFGLAALASHSFDELSGGQRQLVVLARAVVAEADIIVLDEPCAALDLRNQAMILKWMARLADERGATIVFSSHDPSHAAAIGDDVLLMGDGRPQFGPVDRVLQQGALEQVYGVAMQVVRAGEAPVGFLTSWPARRRER